MASENEKFYNLRPFEPWVKEELENREKNIGFNYKESPSGYKGPLTPWMRFASHVAVTDDKGKTMVGFIMTSKGGFENDYGFNNGKDGTILGYALDWQEHRAPENTFKHRPPPGVTAIDIDTMGTEGGKFWKAAIKFTCWSVDQLNYLEPYFFIPSRTCTLEWGWNTVKPPLPLNDWNIINDIALSTDVNKSWETVNGYQKDSNGNCGCLVGKICKASYTIREDGGFDCTVEIQSIGQAIAGVNIKQEQVSDAGKSGTSSDYKETMKMFFDKTIKDYLSEKPKLTNKFLSYYTSQGGPEDRYFTGQELVMEPGKHQGTLNYTNNSDCWITFDLFIDIINAFNNIKFRDKSHKICFINISDSYISASPNLKSNNHAILLIPNDMAPAGFSDDKQAQPPDPDKPESWQTARKKMYGSTKSVDLNKIISVRKKGKKNRTISDPIHKKPVGTSFPEKQNVYRGWIGNLYINFNMVRDVFTKSETILDGLTSVLKSMSAASGNIWDLKIDAITMNNSTLTIKDGNYVEKPIEDLKVDENGKDSPFYKFKVYTDKSILKSFNFESSLSDAVALSVIFDKNERKRFSGRRESENFLSLAKGKDLYLSGGTADKKEERPELYNDEKVQTVRTSRHEGYAKIVRNGKEYILTECDKDVQSTLITSDDNKQNNAIYNGPLQGVEFTMSMFGISGIEFMNCFDVLNMPQRFKDGIFQVKDVKHNITNDGWMTTIVAFFRPK